MGFNVGFWVEAAGGREADAVFQASTYLAPFRPASFTSIENPRGFTSTGLVNGHSNAVCARQTR
jgi:hypothetical protein